MKIYPLEYKTESGKAMRPVSYFIDYQPWRNGYNPNFDDGSNLVLEFKRWNASVVMYFADLIDEDFNPIWKNCCCVAVPSSDSQKTFTPIHEMIGYLVSSRPGLENGSGVLVRTRTVQKLTKGGKRKKEIHLNTISINRNCNVSIFGKDILLIDDVVTTGNSLLACVDILRKGGAKKVFLLTLAKTV